LPPVQETTAFFGVELLELIGIGLAQGGHKIFGRGKEGKKKGGQMHFQWSHEDSMLSIILS